MQAAQNPIAAAPSGLARLDDLGLIRAQGADAASFLHGQLTQDISGLEAGQARLAAFCSAKGRMLATLVAWRPQPDAVLLACSADLLAPTLKRLAMFVLRAKCRLDDATGAYALFGAYGPAADAALAAAGLRPAGVWRRCAAGEDGAGVVRLASPDTAPLYLIAVPIVDGVAAWPAVLSSLPARLPAVAAGDWTLQTIQAGLPWVQASTVEQFVPQMVNLELVGGVHFQKGCYPGQEVVARSQYRGTLKRRMQRFTVAAPAQAGQELFHSADPGQPAGLVARAAADGHGTALLAEVKLASLADGTLHLGAPDGPVLVRQPLPYAVPQDAGEASTAA
jgi:hypothetical protein